MDVIDTRTGERVNGWEAIAKDEEVVTNLARICHETNRAFCVTIDDNSQPEWDQAPDWQKESAKMGVRFHLTGDRLPSDSHESWMKQKVADGWVYGEKKDPEAKTHPCMVAYSELPTDQRLKDYLFRGVVHSYKEFIQKEKA